MNQAQARLSINPHTVNPSAGNRKISGTSFKPETSQERKRSNLGVAVDDSEPEVWMEISDQVIEALELDYRKATEERVRALSRVDNVELMVRIIGVNSLFRTLSICAGFTLSSVYRLYRMGLGRTISHQRCSRTKRMKRHQELIRHTKRSLHVSCRHTKKTVRVKLKRKDWMIYSPRLA